MSETVEPTPETGGTIEAPGPADGGTPTEDYQKRYEDLRPQYDRTQNELQALRQEQERLATDAEAQKELLRQWGYEFEEEPAPEPPADLEELRAQLRAELMGEVEQVKQTQAEIAQAKELEQAENHANQVFQKIGSGRGFELDENERDAIIGRALTMPPDEKGMPPFQAAYDALEAIWEARMAKQAAKRRPSHQFTPGGVAGDSKPDLSTHEGRVANAMAKLADSA